MKIKTIQSFFCRYRAEVLKLLDETPPQAELYYVDYGDTDIVPCAELYELRTDFLRLHFQAIECYLANIGKFLLKKKKKIFD